MITIAVSVPTPCAGFPVFAMLAGQGQFSIAQQTATALTSTPERIALVCSITKATSGCIEKSNVELAPGQNGLVVACKATLCWYWLADFCHERDVPFVLGNTLFMKAIGGGKAKNDRINAEMISALFQGGVLPQTQVYPAGMRETRDLPRRRCSLA